jgi:hypothetical protein
MELVYIYIYIFIVLFFISSLLPILTQCRDPFFPMHRPSRQRHSRKREDEKPAHKKLTARLTRHDQAVRLLDMQWLQVVNDT